MVEIILNYMKILLKMKVVVKCPLLINHTASCWIVFNNFTWKDSLILKNTYYASFPLLSDRQSLATLLLQNGNTAVLFKSQIQGKETDSSW